MKAEHRKILDKIENYLEKPGAENLRFWQALYNMNVIRQELESVPSTKLWGTPELLPRIVDDHNISDAALLKRINE